MADVIRHLTTLAADLDYKIKSATIMVMVISTNAALSEDVKTLLLAQYETITQNLLISYNAVMAVLVTATP